MAIRFRPTKHRAVGEDGFLLAIVFVIIALLVAASVTIGGAVTARIVASENSVLARSAAWDLNSTVNRAAETVTTENRFTQTAPHSEPTKWSLSEDETYTYKWWIASLDLTAP